MEVKGTLTDKLWTIMIENWWAHVESSLQVDHKQTIGDAPQTIVARSAISIPPAHQIPCPYVHPYVRTIFGPFLDPLAVYAIP